MKIDKYRSFNDSLKSDFNDIFSRTESLWSKIKNKNFFLTGCTGFFGYWILKSFLKANQEFKLNSQAYVLTRKKNLKQNPIHKLCSDPSIIFYKGDIRNFKYPRKKFEFIIHGATTTASETFNKQDPLEKSSILIDGTKNILRFAKYCGCKKNTGLEKICGRELSVIFGLVYRLSGAVNFDFGIYKLECDVSPVL